jgi:hypothetical protein
MGTFRGIVFGVVLACLVSLPAPVRAQFCTGDCWVTGEGCDYKTCGFFSIDYGWYSTPFCGYCNKWACGFLDESCSNVCDYSIYYLECVIWV